MEQQKVIEFVAKNVVCYVEDEVCVVSFADSMAADPEKYLILSQALFDSGDDNEDVSIEYGRNGKSSLGGVKRACLEAGRFVLDVIPEVVGVERFEIELATAAVGDLQNHLRKVFSKSDGVLSLK